MNKVISEKFVEIMKYLPENFILERPSFLKTANLRFISASALIIIVLSSVYKKIINPNLSSCFIQERELGRGEFGVVSLVRKRTKIFRDKNKFVMKMVTINNSPKEQKEIKFT